MESYSHKSREDRILERLDEVFGLENVVFTGGLVDKYYLTGQIDLENVRDVDIVIQRNLTEEEITQLQLTESNHSLSTSIIRAYESKQYFGRMFDDVRTDVFVDTVNIGDIEVEYKGRYLRFISKDLRIKYLTSFVHGVQPYYNKAIDKLVQYSRSDYRVPGHRYTDL